MLIHDEVLSTRSLIVVEVMTLILIIFLGLHSIVD